LEKLGEQRRLQANEYNTLLQGEKPTPDQVQEYRRNVEANSKLSQTKQARLERLLRNNDQAGIGGCVEE